MLAVMLVALIHLIKSPLGMVVGRTTVFVPKYCKAKT
tara:strand:- start:12 stop:122 length:111 start_codon:yes stop_codon:yes gene_type:complete